MAGGRRMNRVVAVVEGVTEQSFVRGLLAPHLAGFGVMMTARLVGKPGHKGGVGRYDRARRDILAALRQDTAVFCTTMFDYYGMPDSWPGRAAAQRAGYPQNGQLVETALAQDVAQVMGSGFNSGRFIPYVQLHEFEALLFADPDTLAETLQNRELSAELREIAAQFASPEMINDNPHTSPSKRLAHLFPAYKKVLYGTIASRRIGLPLIREQCSHFADWLTGLEGVGGG